MAYRAEIQIGVVGIGQLGTLQKSLNQISNAIDTINGKKLKQGFNIQNIDTYNNLLAKAVANVNKAAMGEKEELEAVRALVKAKNDQIAAQERLNRLIAQEVANQRKVIPTADMGFGQYGPEAPPVPAGARRGPTSPIGGSKDIPGSPAGRAARFENLALGAGFPLLFGGGAGQVAGGLLGSFVGTGFGGQILGSAIGQILEDAQRRIAEIGNATKTLNVEVLRQSVISVNAELDTTVRRLIEAGRLDEARAVIAAKITAQTGLNTKATESFTKNINTLVNTWNEFLSALTGSFAIIGATTVAFFTVLLKGLAKILQAANAIGSAIANWGLKLVENLLTKFPFLQKLFDRIFNTSSSITEEQEKQNAAIQTQIDKLNSQVALASKLNAIESQRTLGRSIAEKQINIDVERRVALEKINNEYSSRAKDILRENTGANQTLIQQALQKNELARKEAITQQTIKDRLAQQGLEIEANVEKYNRAVEAVQRQIAALERGSQVEQSRFSAEAALNDLYGAQLQRQYELATTAMQRYDIAIAMFYQQTRAAELEYQQAIANNKIIEQKVILEARIVELKYKQMAAEKAIAIAQAQSRGNTPGEIASIAKAYDDALAIQRSAVEDAYAQVTATQEIAKNQEKVAEAVFKTKIIQAESALAQKLMSDEIGLSKNAANNLAGNLALARQETTLLGAGMTDVAAAASSAAYNIRRAFIEQQNLNAARGNTGANPRSIPAFAAGGVVSSPTVGLIGEGGETEYIVPESKAFGFVSNWMAGLRGQDAIPRGSSSAAAPVPQVNIQTGPVLQQDNQRYVTIQDMEKALSSMAGAIVSGSRSYGNRRYTGIA